MFVGVYVYMCVIVDDGTGVICAKLWLNESVIFV